MSFLDTALEAAEGALEGLESLLRVAPDVAERLADAGTVRVPVQSTAIASLTYTRNMTTLNVEFTSGENYVYLEVTPDMFARFLAARSKGVFFNLEVRGQWT